MQNSTTDTLDPESQVFFDKMGEQEKVRANRVAGVRTVLVVLSAKGMVFDVESLRQKILHSYPDSAVFFRTTGGKAIGVSVPHHVDLLVDFTGPGQRQGMFYARKLRRMARVSVGRNAGFFRKKIYNRVYDETAVANLPNETLARERVVQREVLQRAGVAFIPNGDVTADRGKSIALELPAMGRL